MDSNLTKNFFYDLHKYCLIFKNSDFNTFVYFYFDDSISFEVARNNLDVYYKLGNKLLKRFSEDYDFVLYDWILWLKHIRKLGVKKISIV